MTISVLRRASWTLAWAACLGASGLSLAAAPTPAPAAGSAASTPGWPSRPLKIIVGFPGGSSPDLVARTVAEPLSKALGQPVIVENKVGAAGNIGADAVVRATDNHTIGLMINGNMTIAKLVNPKVSYNPTTDLTPVSLLAVAPLALAAPAHAPGATIEEFLAAARQAGDRWSYGSPGVGTVAHLGMELLKSKTGINPVHVPYPGNPQIINGLISGELQIALIPPAMAAVQADTGRLRFIGVTSSSRSPMVAKYPSLAEGGVKNFNLEIWNAVAAPNSMPKAIVHRLSALFSDITRSPDVRAKLFQQGWQVVGSSEQGLANRIQSDTQVLGHVIQLRGIKAE